MPPSGWSYVQCGSDSPARALPEAYYQDPSMNVNMCLSHCAQQGYVFAGLEASTECHCGNTIQNNQGSMLPDIECSAPCGGTGTSGQCGGLWKISIFSSLSGDDLAAALPPAPVSSSGGADKDQTDLYATSGGISAYPNPSASSASPAIPVPSSPA